MSLPSSSQPLQPNKIANRLAAIRHELASANLDAFIIPRADEYLGEYVPEHNEAKNKENHPQRMAECPLGAGTVPLDVRTPGAKAAAHSCHGDAEPVQTPAENRFSLTPT